MKAFYLIFHYLGFFILTAATTLFFAFCQTLLCDHISCNNKVVVMSRGYVACNFSFYRGKSEWSKIKPILCILLPLTENQAQIFIYHGRYGTFQVSTQPANVAWVFGTMDRRSSTTMDDNKIFVVISKVKKIANVTRLSGKGPLGCKADSGCFQCSSKIMHLICG